MRKQITAAILALGLGLLSTIAAGQAEPSQKAEAVKITQGPTVESTTGSGATIAWSTNQASGTVVKYGTDPANLNQTAQTPWGGITHRVLIKNLQPNTTYFFKVDSSNARDSGTSVASDVEQFQTKAADIGAAQNKTPQQYKVLAGPVVQDLTPTAATLWWHSDQSAPAQVKYGLSATSLDKTAIDSGGAQDHKTQLSELEPAKTYYYSVSRPDGSQTVTGQFTTPQDEDGTNVKIIAGPVIEYVGHNHAIVAWSTSAPASSIVKYGTDPSSLNQTAQAPWGSTTHRVDIKNLHPNTKYFFEVVSNQAQGTGTMAESATGQLQTMGQGQQALALVPQH